MIYSLSISSGVLSLEWSAGTLRPNAAFWRCQNIFFIWAFFLWAPHYFLLQSTQTVRLPFSRHCWSRSPVSPSSYISFAFPLKFSMGC